jgi:1,4-dihydroxy-2-naphthoate octaprenyltransferase
MNKINIMFKILVANEELTFVALVLILIFVAFFYTVGNPL